MNPLMFSVAHGAAGTRPSHDHVDISRKITPRRRACAWAPNLEHYYWHLPHVWHRNAPLAPSRTIAVHYNPHVFLGSKRINYSLVLGIIM
jgi:hypothetical protein